MFRHTVMFRWSPDAPDTAKAAVSAGLAELPSAIDTIVDYRFGPDAGVNDGNWDYVVVADFADEAGYVVYRDDPTHQRFITESIKPIVVERAAVQVQLED